MTPETHKWVTYAELAIETLNPVSTCNLHTSTVSWKVVTMECPQCGQAVLVENGAITPHLDPHTLQLCSAEAKDEEPKAKAAPKKKA